MTTHHISGPMAHRHVLRHRTHVSRPTAPKKAHVSHVVTTTHHATKHVTQAHHVTKARKSHMTKKANPTIHYKRGHVHAHVNRHGGHLYLF